ncbi:hypothetical protein H4R19_006664, partial [Coemansia spiralis]
AFAASDVEYLVSTRLGPRFARPPAAPTPEAQPLASTTAAALRKDYVTEDECLRAAIEHGLGEYYDEILRIVSDHIEDGPMVSGEQPVSSDAEDARMDYE